MLRLFLLSIWLVPASAALCETAVQSDWSGDSGVWGPLPAWRTEYYSTRDLWGTQLELPLEQTVEIVSLQVNEPGSVIAGDLYTNGLIDIAFINYATDEVRWLKRLANGSYVGPYTVAENCYWADRLVLCDLNGDGNEDILGYSSDHYGVKWWENQLSWTEPWQEHTVSTSDSPHSIEACDIDGDGDMDIVQADVLEDLIWIENSNGLGTSWEPHTVAGSSHRIADTAVEDMDGDGDPDIVAAGFSSSGFLCWFENQDGTGTSWAYHTVGSGFYFNTVSTWDPDLDGDVDILCSSSVGESVVRWWENLGGEYWEVHDIFVGSNFTHSLVPADLDLDGDTDFILGRGSRVLMWFENTDAAGTMEGFEIDLSPGYPTYCSLADLNQDGYLELLPTVYDFDGIFFCNMGFYGSLESSLLDAGDLCNWGLFCWESTPSPGGSVSFQVRSSTLPDSSWMGEWSQEITEPVNLSEILPQGDRYFQYRAILKTSDLESSPVLNSVSLDYFTGIEQAGEPRSFSIEPVVNPSPGAVILRIVADVEDTVSISIHDVSGRLVRNQVLAGIPMGESAASIEGLPPGVYMLRAVCGEEIVSGKIAVVR